MQPYGLRINRAVHFIEDNFRESPSIEEIAEAAHLSPYHFHRIFWAHMNVTVGDYVRSRRLNEAARELTRTTSSVLDIAIGIGYESQEAFARAFKKQFGMTPAQFRAHRDYAKPPSFLRIEDAPGCGDLDPRFVELEAKRVIGIARPRQEASFSVGSEQWQAFTGAPVRPPYKGAFTGIAIDDHPLVPKKPGDRFIYVCGVEVSEDESVPEGMTEVFCPAGRYLVFTHRGHIAAGSATIKRIWQSAIDACGAELRDAPELEIYGPRFSLESAQSEFDIFIPVV